MGECVGGYVSVDGWVDGCVGGYVSGWIGECG